MHSKIKSVWKLAAAVMLFFAGAPLYAANQPMQIVQTMGFVEAGQGRPFITGKDMTQGAASDGSLVFSLDLLFGTDAEKAYGILPLIHYHSEKVEIIKISHIADAGFAKPKRNPQRNKHYTPDMPPLITIAGESVEADADTAMLLPWSNILRELSSVAGATVANPVRVATIKFKWKAGAAGNSHIGITQSAFGTATDFRGSSISLHGPAMAKIIASPKSIDATADTAPLRVKCALSRPLPAETTCTLGGNGDAVPGADYTASPDIEGAAIVIPPGRNSSARTFTITPAESGSGKTLDITLRAAVSAGAPLARNAKSAGVVLALPGLEVSKTSIVTKEKVESRDKKFKVRLAVPPSGGDVVVAIRSTDTSEASVSPASLRFTADNWNEKREVTVKGEDDEFDDGDRNYRIHLSVDNGKTGATRYHGKTASVSGTTIDNDEAAAKLKAVPAYLSEAGGKQRIVITAKLREKVFFESDTRITLSKAGGSATEHIDYKMFDLPDSVIIPAGKPSASLTFSIHTRTDVFADEKETIAIAGAFDRADLGALALELTISEFNLDVDLSGGANGRAAVTAQDGILIARYLRGVRGDALTAGQTDTPPAIVAERIEDCIGVLDVNEQDGADHDDGTLVARYLLGLRGDELMSEIGDPRAAPTVERNIGRFLP